MTKYEKKRWKVRMRKVGRMFTSAAGNGDEDLTPVQLRAIQMTKKLILKSDSVLRVAPLSDTCYVENSNIFIKFGYSYLVVRTKQSTFYFTLPFSASDRLIGFFNRQTERRRQEMEQEYDLTTLSHLDRTMKEIGL